MLLARFDASIGPNLLSDGEFSAAWNTSDASDLKDIANSAR